MWRRSGSTLVSWMLVFAAIQGCAGAPAIASVAVFPSPDGPVALGGHATPTPTERGLRMICTGRTCTVCDVEIDIRTYPSPGGTEFTSIRTQGPMNGAVELIAITFQDSVSLAHATELLNTLLRRAPVLQDDRQVEWTDGRDRVRLVKGRGRPASATIRPDPRRIRLITCPQG